MSQLDIARKFRAIVSNLGNLVRARCLDVRQIQRSRDWRDEEVAVLALRSAKVQMRKAKDVTEAEIAEAGAATVEGRYIRSELHHAVRNRGTDKRVPSPINPNERIDIMGKILYLRPLSKHRSA